MPAQTRDAQGLPSEPPILENEDILNQITGYLDAESLAKFACVCKRTRDQVKANEPYRNVANLLTRVSRRSEIYQLNLTQRERSLLTPETTARALMRTTPRTAGRMVLQLPHSPSLLARLVCRQNLRRATPSIIRGVIGVGFAIALTIAAGVAGTGYSAWLRFLAAQAFSMFVIIIALGCYESENRNLRAFPISRQQQKTMMGAVALTAITEIVLTSVAVSKAPESEKNVAVSLGVVGAVCMLAVVERLLRRLFQYGLCARRLEVETGDSPVAFWSRAQSPLLDDVQRSPVNNLLRQEARAMVQA